MTSTNIAHRISDSGPDTGTGAGAGRPLRILLVVASVRSGRLADVLLPWLTDRIDGRPWLDLDTLDLRTVAVDDAALAPGASGPVAERIAAADAFLVLTPEYNHSFPGPLKSLLDAHLREWSHKPAAFVSYGAASGGLRAVEQLRPVFSELRATTVRNCVSLVAPWERLDGAAYLPTEAENGALEATLAELRWWAAALRVARETTAVPA